MLAFFPNNEKSYAYELTKNPHKLSIGFIVPLFLSFRLQLPF